MEWFDEVNIINIILILKVTDSKIMAEFRFISFCKVMYKIVSKFMVNRFKFFFDEIISEN